MQATKFRRIHQRSVPRFLVELESLNSPLAQDLQGALVPLTGMRLIHVTVRRIPDIFRIDHRYTCADGSVWYLRLHSSGNSIEARKDGEQNLPRAWDANYHEWYELTPQGLAYIDAIDTEAEKLDAQIDAQPPAAHSPKTDVNNAISPDETTGYEVWVSATEATKLANRITLVGRNWGSYWSRFCKKHGVIDPCISN